MAVGAIGGISTAYYNPYVYNTRSVSAASLNSIDRISDDATDGGVDFSSIDEENAVNINPLKKGETANFADILMSQFSTSAIRQSEVFNSPSAENQANPYMFNKAFMAYGIN